MALSAPSTNSTWMRCKRSDILDFTYGFNLGAGNNASVASITNNLNTARTQTFTYDQLDRIATAKTQATNGTYAWGLQFGMDIWGNLTSASVTQGSAPMLSVSAATNNRLSGFSYDALGNMLNDGSYSYVYNAAGQIKIAAGVNYTYDGDGNRVQKSNGKLYWYGLGGQVLDESDASGNVTDEYVFFAGRRVAHRDSSNNIYYYFEDHLGTSRVITNATGTVCYDADFYPYGGERTAYTNTCSQNYKFTGKERDPETGNDDFGARYYSSSFGRFVIADWSAVPAPVPYADLTNPQTLNLYAYVKNNPLRYTDPTGHVTNPFDVGPEGGHVPNSDGGSAGVCMMTATGVGGRCVYGPNIYDAPSDFSFINWQKNTEQNNSSTASNQNNAQGQDQAQNQNATTLNLGGTKVDVTLSAAQADGGGKGAVIEANPQGCGDCRWAQTVTRAGDPAQATQTDRTLPNQPLYPTSERANGLYDAPSSHKGGSGTFTAVTTLGVANQSNKTFKVLGSMTWGYKVDKSGNVSLIGPRVATRAEQARSIAVLKRDSPTWKIGP